MLMITEFIKKVTTVEVHVRRQKDHKGEIPKIDCRES
jgi:hypothetical protein